LSEGRQVTVGRDGERALERAVARALRQAVADEVMVRCDAKGRERDREGEERGRGGS
jgi:hypothetical protein